MHDICEAASATLGRWSGLQFYTIFFSTINSVLTVKCCDLVMCVYWFCDILNLSCALLAQIKKGVQAVEESDAVRKGWVAVGTHAAWNDHAFTSEALLTHAEGKLFKASASSSASTPTQEVGMCVQV